MWPDTASSSLVAYTELVRIWLDLPDDFVEQLAEKGQDLSKAGLPEETVHDGILSARRCPRGNRDRRKHKHEVPSIPFQCESDRRRSDRRDRLVGRPVPPASWIRGFGFDDVGASFKELSAERTVGSDVRPVRDRTKEAGSILEDLDSHATQRTTVTPPHRPGDSALRTRRRQS